MFLFKTWGLAVTHKLTFGTENPWGFTPSALRGAGDGGMLWALKSCRMLFGKADFSLGLLLQARNNKENRCF